MLNQILSSFAVGGAISALALIPLLIWQYRSFGRPDWVRMLWIFAGYVYASALVAFTIFPLPSFGDAYCAKYATHPLWNPLRFPRDFAASLSAHGLQSTLLSPLVWEFGMNMVLFIPFGVMVRRIFELPRWVVLLAGLGTSILIEATQGTANWGLSPCSYRFTDTTDLFTNTAGTLLGLGLEAITPRLLSRKDTLEALRDQARRVTKLRRLTGIVIDLWYLLVAGLLGAGAGLAVFMLRAGHITASLSAADQERLVLFMTVGGIVAQFVIVLLSGLTGTGASFGQRTVYLAPWAPGRGRLSHVIRAMSVQGIGVLLPLFGVIPALIALGLWLVALIRIFFDVRGISYRVSRNYIVDARAID